MTAGPAEVIRQWIINAGLGQASDVVDWVVWRNKEGPAPIKSITVSDSGAVKDGRLMRGGINILHDSIQVRVRGMNESEARLKAKTIELTLEGLLRHVLAVGAEQIMIDNFSVTMPTTFMGQQEKLNAKVFVFNGNLTLAEV